MAKTGTKLGLVDLSSDYPLVEASGGQAHMKVGLDELSSDIPPRHLVAKTGPKLGLLDLSSDYLFQTFSIAFLISGDESSSVEVIPCYSDTSD